MLSRHDRIGESDRFCGWRAAFYTRYVIIWRTGVRFVSSISIRKRAKKGNWKITVLNTGFILRLLTCLDDTIVLERDSFGIRTMRFIIKSVLIGVVVTAIVLYGG